MTITIYIRRCRRCRKDFKTTSQIPNPTCLDCTKINRATGRKRCGDIRCKI